MQNRMGFPGIGQVVALALMIVAMLFVFGSPPERSASQALPGEYVLIDIVDRPLPKGIEPLEVYDAFVLAQVTPKTLETLAANTRVEPLPDRTVVSLNGWVFDTLQGEPPIEDTLRAAPDDPYFLIQFYGPVKNDWVSNLEAMGVTFLGYHPNYTYIVRMNPILLSKVRAAHAVQWVGHYHPAYRLASDTELQKAFTLDTQVVLDVYGFPSENPVELLTGLETLGIHIEWSTTEGQVVARVWATQTQLFALTTLRGVYRVEAYNPPELNNEIGAQVMNTWDVWRANRNGLLQDLMGQGQIAGMVDSGLDANTTTPKHSDYYQYDNGVKVTRIAAARAGAGCTGSCSCYGTAGDHLNSSGHGTHVAGSIVGNGYSSLLQQGLQAQARSNDPFFDYAWGVGQAPEAKIAFAYVAGRSGATQGTLCGIGNARTTWLDLYTQGARNVNNSWGNSTFAYGGSSLLADQTMWERQDYLIVTSAGNDGPGWATMGQPSNGKNLVTVGAAGNHRSTWGQSSDTANLLTDFSSRGPLNPSGNDYRFKPDVVAPGADILSTRSTFIPNTEIPLWMNEPGDGDADGVQDYLWSGGTSMSSPLVTGAATIIRQYLQDIKGLGNTTPPSAALIKAMLVNGAVDMGYGYEALTTAPYGGRNMQGWGMVNVENSIIPRAPRSFIYEDFTNITDVAKQSTIGLTASGRYVEYTINVVDASEPLKITLTWTDLQTGASAYAVNNLNLLVTAPGGTSYIGNMFSGSWSTTGGTADAKNNTEAVYLNNPATGTWTIRVTDQAHGSGTQPFALLISGGLGVNPAFGNRTCSWGSCPVTRSGSSSPPYFPSLKPLAGSDEQMPAGTSFTTAFQLTNWGVNADTLSLSYSVTDKSGNAVSGITVDFNPAGPVALASGASQNIEATLHASGNVGQGAYDVTLTATSSGTGNRKNAIVVGLNIIPHTSTFNETRVVLDTGPQFAPAFWSTGQTLWAAYLSAQSHNNSEAKIYAARSTDGGQTWTTMGQVDANDGKYLYSPAIAGNTDGTSITVLWIPADASGVYARTWTQAGGWGVIKTLNTSTTLLSDPKVIYDNDGHILAVWLYYDGTTSTGLYSSFSTNDGGIWTAAAAVPDATGGTYRYESLTLDTRNNHVWMAYCPPASSGANRDVRAKYWNGNTNTWTATGNTVTVATTADREIRPAITYIQGTTAAQDALWIAWVRYPGWADVTPRLYYARSSRLSERNLTFDF